MTQWKYRVLTMAPTSLAAEHLQTLHLQVQSLSAPQALHSYSADSDTGPGLGANDLPGVSRILDGVLLLQCIASELQQHDLSQSVTPV